MQKKNIELDEIIELYNTESKAYFLGLMYADGSVSKKEV